MIRSVHGKGLLVAAEAVAVVVRVPRRSVRLALADKAAEAVVAVAEEVLEFFRPMLQIIISRIQTLVEEEVLEESRKLQVGKLATLN